MAKNKEKFMKNYPNYSTLLVSLSHLPIVQFILYICTMRTVQLYILHTPFRPYSVTHVSPSQDLSLPPYHTQ